MERGVLLVRVLVIAALVTVAAAIATTIGGTGAYETTARFRDAGQLVEGARVQIAGRPVGTITQLGLADDGVAEARLRIDDEEVAPLHRGTVASIRALSLSGVANRVVELSPGPASAPEIPDGGTLSLTETRGIVDLDAVLSSIDAPARERLRSLLRGGGEIFRDPGTAKDANRAFEYLEPATAQVQALAAEVARDTAALGTLVRAGAGTAAALASRQEELRAGLRDTGRTLAALSAERRAVGDLLRRAPAAARRTRVALRDTRRTLRAARPALAELRRAAPGATAVLQRLVPASRRARPVLEGLGALLPVVDQTLRRTPALERAGVPALRSATTAIGDSTPIFAGLRPYSMDLVSGLVKGLGGGTGLSYDANGHYVRVGLGAGGAVNSGLLSLLGDIDPPFLRPTKGQRARCPGAAAVPAADGSNPWLAQPGLCDQEQRRR